MDIKEEHKTECKLNSSVCSPEYIIEEVKDKLNVTLDEPDEIIYEAIEKTNCDSESCLIKKVIVNNDVILDKYFKPEGPRNDTSLLDNYNIDNVLKQWTEIYPKFYFIKFQMIDFEEMKTELATVNILDIIKNGYKSMGVVLNTDVSSGKGIHWFCLYCEFKSNMNTLEYFNSSGRMPRDEVLAWLNKTNSILNDNGIKSNIVIASNIQHQIDSETECGPYSLYYIWSRLNKVSYKEFDNKRIPDKKMIEFRETLFRYN